MPDTTLPKTVTDPVGEEEKRASWEFCGAFPLRAIMEGRRACRCGWRDVDPHDLDDDGDSDEMFAVIANEDNGHLYLFLQRESALVFGDEDCFNDATDMAALDWYIEIQKKTVS